MSNTTDLKPALDPGGPGIAGSGFAGPTEQQGLEHVCRELTDERDRLRGNSPRFGRSATST